MFDQKTSEYFYKQISLIKSERKGVKEDISALYILFKEAVNTALINENQFFSSFYSKLLFVIQNFSIPEDIKERIISFRSIFKNILSNDFVITEKHLKSSFYTIIKFVDFFSDEVLPKEFNEIIIEGETLQFYFDRKYPSNKKDFEGLVIVEIDKPKKEIYCNSEELGLIKIKLNQSWSETIELVEKGNIINVFNLKANPNQSNSYSATLDTLIAIEPDYLFDATEIAECFGMKGYDPISYFIKKFDNSDISDSMIAGNYVNTCFDELLTKDKVEFEDVWDYSIKQKPLQIFSLALKDKNIVKQIKDKVELQFNNLTNIVKKFKFEKLSIEPTFISPKYGLQGRLDALIESFDDPNKKDIIELKSGKAPDSKLVTKSDSGKNVVSFIWNNHHAQATCYNMLLNSAFENRTGTSSILYSGSITEPMRNAENIFFKQQEILKLRNKIVAYESQLRNGNFDILKILAEDIHQDQSYFIKRPLEKFRMIYSGADALELEYFHNYIRFIHNEIYAGKLGTSDNRNNGFASLWQSNIDEKKENYSIITNLKLNKDASDFTNFHLKFDIDLTQTFLTSLRNGDMVILYSVGAEGTNDVLKNQVIKCVIKEISFDFILLSLRNKQFDKNVFSEDKTWVIETDYIDASNKKLLASVYELLKANFKKKGLLLGLIEPAFEQNAMIYFKGLNESQNEIVNKALNAKDYFLIQGPPGTGKTSYVLKTIVDELYKNPDNKILVMAYTNRAVDEICSSLKKISPAIEFLRAGSKESSIHHDVLISTLTDTLTMRDLFIKVRDVRVIVSTVSSVLSNPEIMNLKDYNIAIVDEATQILEPHLVGILSKIEKFILIGDEKQLPAVVIQEDSKTKVESELLKGIQLDNLSNSLFERLLKRCLFKNWSAYNILTFQARMHKDIQDFPNKYFYNNNLKTMPSNDWQLSATGVIKPNEDNEIIKLLTSSRMVFINSEREFKSKVNISEAKQVKLIVNELIANLGESFNENSIGIISPFRAQCAEIYRQLGIELKQKILCDTVERFQGSEKDIIIISLAVNYEVQLQTIQSIAQFGDTIVDRKLNVAMTRAKHNLIILGNEYILNKSQIYSDLIEYIQGVGGFFERGEM